MELEHIMTNFQNFLPNVNLKMGSLLKGKKQNLNNIIINIIQRLNIAIVMG
jgi:hypothetical protein